MAVDLKDNIVFGGRSTDINIVSVVNQIFIGYLESSGFDYKWLKRLNSHQSSVCAQYQDIKYLGFDSQSKKLVVFLYSDHSKCNLPQTFAVLNVADGDLVKAVREIRTPTTYQFLDSNLIMITSKDQIFLNVEIGSTYDQ